MSKGNKQPRPGREFKRKGEKSEETSILRYDPDPVMIGTDNTIRIDLSKVHAPSNVYDADFAWIVHRPGAVSLLFAKRNMSGNNTLRTRLEVRFPPENLVNNFWKAARDFHLKLQDFVSKWPKEEGRDLQSPEEWPAEKDHSEWANFETMAHAGSQASIDFYLLPPWGIAQFLRGGGSSQLILTPIVRVQMTAFELKRLLDSVAKVVAEIGSYLPESAKDKKALQEEKAL
jgi:hypothetical protein